MRKIVFFVFMFITPIMYSYAKGAKDLKSQQRKQESIIKSAHKRNKITEIEFQKLLREQEAIKDAIDKYDADGIWTSHELNVIHGKLERAENRLKRYKNNSEIY